MLERLTDLALPAGQQLFALGDLGGHVDVRPVGPGREARLEAHRTQQLLGRSDRQRFQLRGRNGRGR